MSVNPITVVVALYQVSHSYDDLEVAANRLQELVLELDEGEKFKHRKSEALYREAGNININHWRNPTRYIDKGLKEAQTLWKAAQSNDYTID